MNKQKYIEYLKSDHWQSFKVKVYKSRKRCFICKRKTWLNIHHLSYKNLGHEKMSDVIVLCRFCHHEYHRNGGKKLLDWAKKIRNAQTFKIPYQPKGYNIMVKMYKHALKTRDFMEVLDYYRKNEQDIFETGIKAHIVSMRTQIFKQIKKQENKRQKLKK